MPAKRTIKTKTWLLWFLLSVAVWVFGYFCLRGVDSSIYGVAGRVLMHWGGDEYPQLHREGEEIEMENFVTEKRTLVCPTVGMVELNEQTSVDCFAALPLGPQDMATLLSYLNGAGIHTVGVSSPLVWEDEVGEMARMMFCSILEKFPASGLGLRGRTAAQADFTPNALRDAAIPAENLKGDSKGLPVANRPLPNGLTNSPDALKIAWAPDWLEDEPQTQRTPAVDNISFPLLVRWNGEAIPTLPFYLALKRNGLSPKDVHVHFGKEISFGGRTLPLDEYGRTRLTTAKVTPVPLTDVVGGKGKALKDLAAEKESCLILAEPDGGKADPERLRLIARTLSELAGKEHREYIPGQRPCGGHVLEEAPVQRDWWTLAWLLPCMMLFVRFLPFASSPIRRIVSLGVLALLLYHAYGYFEEGQWLGISGALLAWCTLCIALRCLEPEKQGIFHHRRSSRR